MVLEIKAFRGQFRAGHEGAGGAVYDLDAVLFQDGGVQVGQFFGRLHPEIFLVVPLGLVGVETGAGLDDALQREHRNQLVQGVELGVVARVPAQESEHVDKGLREVAVLAVAAGDFTLGIDPAQGEHREAQAVAVALGELALAVRLEQQRQMRETGHGIGPSERLVQQVVQRQGREPLLAADDLGDFHQMVVHDVGEVVGRELVGPLPEHLVVQGVGIDGDVAADEVVHLHDAVLRHLEADGPVRGFRQQVLHLARGKGEGVAEGHARHRVVGEGLTLGLGGLAAGVQFLRRIERVVGPSGFHELVGVLPVDGTPLALAVGRMGMLRRGVLHHLAVGIHTLVGDDAAPTQGFDDVFLRARDEPVGVGIFDPEDEISSVLLGIQVVVQGRPDAAHVERTGRRRGETDACSSFHSDLYKLELTLKVQR